MGSSAAPYPPGPTTGVCARTCVSASVLHVGHAARVRAQDMAVSPHHSCTYRVYAFGSPMGGGGPWCVPSSESSGPETAAGRLWP